MCLYMNNKTESFYNRFSILYPFIDAFLMFHKKLLCDEVNNVPDGKLLEIGVGNGSHFKFYKKHQIVGIDISENMLEIARKRNYKNIELIKMNGKQLLFNDEQFDYVVLSHVIAVVDDQEQLMKEVLRTLKPQGQVFILNHFTPNNWLRYIDYLFNGFSKIFHFKSVFYIDQVTALKKINLLKEVSLGLTSYYKLLIYQKKTASSPAFSRKRPLHKEPVLSQHSSLLPFLCKNLLSQKIHPRP